MPDGRGKTSMQGLRPDNLKTLADLVPYFDLDDAKPAEKKAS